MKRLALIAFFLVFAGAAMADSPITVSDAWARATATDTGVVYFKANDSGDADTLTGASTPIATKVTLHLSKMEGSVVKMTAVSNVAIDKDHSITFKPGGYHLMLEGLKQKLKTGDTFPLTLTFAAAGAVTTTVTVKDTGATSHRDMDSMHMDMSR